jgi:hypothetical protein
MTATITQPVTSGVTPPAEVSQEEFLQQLKAMHEHHQAIDPTVTQSIKPYSLPAHLSLVLPHTPASPGTTPAVQPGTPASPGTTPAVQPGTPASPGTTPAVQPGTPAPKETAERTALIVTRLVKIGAPSPAAQSMAAALDNHQQKILAFVDQHQGALLHAVAAARDPKSTQNFAQQMNALREATKADHRARIDAMFASFTAIGTAHPAARPVILNTGNKVATFGAGVASGATNVIVTVASAVQAGGSAIAKATDAVGKWGSDAVHSVKHFFGSLF